MSVHLRYLKSFKTFYKSFPNSMFKFNKVSDPSTLDTVLLLYEMNFCKFKLKLT